MNELKRQQEDLARLDARLTRFESHVTQLQVEMPAMTANLQQLAKSLNDLIVALQSEQDDADADPTSDLSGNSNPTRKPPSDSLF
jgi:peptidoglycan hydrolase CwlO-like protein